MGVGMVAVLAAARRRRRAGAAGRARGVAGLGLRRRCAPGSGERGDAEAKGGGGGAVSLVGRRSRLTARTDRELLGLSDRWRSARRCPRPRPGRHRRSRGRRSARAARGRPRPHGVLADQVGPQAVKVHAASSCTSGHGQPWSAWPWLGRVPWLDPLGRLINR